MTSETLANCAQAIVHYESNGKDLTENKAKKDQEYYFTQYIAAELRSFSDTECFMIKHKINIIEQGGYFISLFDSQLNSHINWNLQSINPGTFS